MVAKDTYYNERQWKSDQESLWKLDGEGRRVPPEAYILGRLRQAAPEAIFIVQSLGHHSFHTLRMYRIYMEFCSWGDLHDVMKHHSGLAGKLDENDQPIERYSSGLSFWSRAVS